MLAHRFIFGRPHFHFPPTLQIHVMCLDIPLLRTNNDITCRMALSSSPFRQFPLLASPWRLHFSHDNFCIFFDYEDIAKRVRIHNVNLCYRANFQSLYTLFAHVVFRLSQRVLYPMPAEDLCFTDNLLTLHVLWNWVLHDALLAHVKYSLILVSCTFDN